MPVFRTNDGANLGLSRAFTIDATAKRRRARERRTSLIENLEGRTLLSASPTGLVHHHHHLATTTPPTTTTVDPTAPSTTTTSTDPTPVSAGTDTTASPATTVTN